MTLWLLVWKYMNKRGTTVSQLIFSTIRLITIVLLIVSCSTFLYFPNVLSRTFPPKILMSMPARDPFSSVLSHISLYPFFPYTLFPSCKFLYPFLPALPIIMLVPHFPLKILLIFPARGPYSSILSLFFTVPSCTVDFALTFFCCDCNAISSPFVFLEFSWRICL